jgi:LmbE family N-acetylglucosaminyl deacetylase
MRAPVLMVVHAHPDDESSQTGGTLARYAAAGYRTVLVTCTDGRQGDAAGGVKAGQPGHDPHQVATERSRELDLAAAALGLHAVVKLGYPDSGVSDGGERGAAAESFSLRPARPMVARLVRLMQLYRPEVLVTYPPNGFSMHPDHIRTHDLVVAAHRHIIANDEAEGGRSPAPRLYYIALSRARLREVQTRARAALGADAFVPPDEMAVDDARITTVIDVAEFWPEKLRALAAHASQSDAAALLQMFGAADESVGRVEEYMRAYPAPTEPIVVENDFFNDGR